jgi:hypothetical protein
MVANNHKTAEVCLHKCDSNAKLKLMVLQIKSLSVQALGLMVYVSQEDRDPVTKMVASNHNRIIISLEIWINA